MISDVVYIISTFILIIVLFTYLLFEKGIIHICNKKIKIKRFNKNKDIMTIKYICNICGKKIAIVTAHKVVPPIRFKNRDGIQKIEWLNIQQMI